MGVPVTVVPVVEIQMHGKVNAAGSSTKNADFVFHYRLGSGSVPPSVQHIEAAFQAAVAIPVTNALNARYVQTFTTARIINDVTNNLVQVTRAVAGQVAGDSMPTINQAYILQRTAYRGKNWRGSKKLFPMSESDTTTGTDDTFNAAALVRLGAIATAILAGLTDSDGNTWVAVVLSKKLSQLRVNPTTIYTADITSILLNKRVGRNKRREVASQY